MTSITQSPSLETLDDGQSSQLRVFSLPVISLGIPSLDGGWIFSQPPLDEMFQSGPGPRTSFQRWWASQVTGKILNIGCNNDPMGLVEPIRIPDGTPVAPGLRKDVVQFDLDYWPHKQFIQGDAHILPFRDGWFEMAVMGDIHEHLVDPLKASLESCRVSKRWVVWTIFEEWRLPGHGQFIDEGQRMSNLDTIRAFGGKYNTPTEMILATANVQAYDDIKLPHLSHINQFSDEDIAGIVHVCCKTYGYRLVNFFKVPEQVQDGHQWFNWLVCLERQT